MRAVVVHSRNPFQPADRRIVELRRRRRIGAYAARSVDLSRPVICLRNGAPVLRRDWQRTVIEDGDTVAFVTLPQGGGGSNPLRTVLMLALVVAAPYVVGLASTLTGIGFTTLQANLIAAGFVMAGSALVNALLPPPKPPTPQLAASLTAASPTYNIAAQGNQARLEQPIPVIYGRHLISPDFAAAPYMEYAGNEQFLYQLFCIGQGSYDVEAIRIEDTAIASFPEITYELVPPQGTVTLFPTDVITSLEVAGQEALQNTPLGPFVASAAGSSANYIGIDIVAPKGLFYANDSGGMDAKAITWTVEARAIDDAGLPLGAYATLGTESISAATTTPQRRSYKYLVASGRYEVRLTRTDAKDTDARAGHDLAWSGLRAYLPGTQQYGNVTMLAMRMQASNSLSAQAARRINCIVTRKLKKWHPSTGWSAELATRDIAWAALDILRNTEYGAGLPDSRLPLQELYTLQSTWTARLDTFDAVFDSRIQILEALTHVLRAGRAMPFEQSGLVRVVRDAAQSIPSALFSPRNIAKGSFRLEYIMPSDETPDAVEVEYFDAQTWTPQRVTAQLPEGTNLKPAKVQLFGATGRAQAWREGMYMAASNRYRRRLVGLQTELEGHIPAIGDLVAVSHDLPAWGQSGELLGYTALTIGGVLALSEPVTFGAGNHYVALRKRDGSIAGPYLVTAGADATHVVLAEAVTGFTPDTDGTRERAHYSFGTATGLYMLCRIVAPIRPRGRTVELNAVVEAAEVHAADGGTPPAETPGWNLPNVPVLPSIPGELFVVASGSPDAPLLSVSWSAASGADYYILEHGLDGIAWTRIAEPTVTSHQFSVTPGINHVRVAPVGKAQGPWITWSGSVGGSAAVQTPPQATGLTATAVGLGILLQWPDQGYAFADRIEILRHTSNDPGGASVIGSVPGKSPARVYVDDIGQGGQARWYWIRIVNIRQMAGAVSDAATATTGALSDADLNAISAAKLTGQITTTQITDGAISTPKLQAGAVSSATIAAGAVVAGKIGASAVTATELAAGAVAAGKIAAGAVTAGTVAANVIGTNELAANSITAAKGQIADAAVQTLKIGANQVTLPASASATGIPGTAPSYTIIAQILSMPTDALGSVVLAASFTANGLYTNTQRREFSCRIERSDGTVLWTGGFTLFGYTSAQQDIHGGICGVARDSPGNGGTYHYYATASHVTAQGTLSTFGATITAMGAKR